ncbi:hypothetical protein A3J17_01725 [Candidatus Curtissbacteria bacterium RIFCSPLOWO2_02_FULL_40_11]|uniref:DUF2130 domain-containing protein n=2 Tax=Candidatus Curtissiibacteriota TaxID=1752717 RepID=A0A1F5G9T4_9BACT|nr:MAG: hypothetical protein A2775_02145 [Candidatus Curtissbacteria bacterium RIFCSPHIGHO2_01_FULL_39_57]OGD88642.1 MAG: hypothetical protein A3D04_00225 [Candidatus Curtissbacteria bacterium RIFCSPHIGHO2_02_FULL_40_16b]OGD99465.1 MAG: hypothetical protein A3J17_01725 [Candidatus Curtissbacteria bacterium RIFCSPLOWO2_02_FULL_40_11]OGE12130.1 MAG: hypothetical protein A3G14_01000 [Candidatus Curtissbacteria bacterium RIFCSPLOWO2_12_FULL_38_9]
MSNTITCPHCKKLVEISEALRHEFEASNKEELEKAKKEAVEIATQKVAEKAEFKLKDSKNENEELKSQNKGLRNQLLELNKTVRALNEKLEKTDLEIQKKVSEELKQAKEEIYKDEKEKSQIQIDELRKQLEDTKKALTEAQRKAQQSSQQLQGEVLELNLEELLIDSFPHDSIEPIGKGVKGADVRQTVKSPKGYPCGVILWESKRTKGWTDSWISKLKGDLRAEKANIPVIVSESLPQNIKGMGLRDGVWVVSFSLILPLASLLRKNLLDIGYQKAVSLDRGSKADSLYEYITGHEFRQQVEAMLEVYKEMGDQVNKERVAFEKSWAAREAQVKRLFLSTANIYGSMQGKVGFSSLPQIRDLELLELESGEDDKEKAENS